MITWFGWFYISVQTIQIIQICKGSGSYNRLSSGIRLICLATVFFCVIAAITVGTVDHRY